MFVDILGKLPFHKEDLFILQHFKNIKCLLKIVNLFKLKLSNQENISSQFYRIKKLNSYLIFE